MRPARMRPARLRALALALFVGSLTACGSGFDPYNEIQSLRLLAIRAEPPTLLPGETTSLDALVDTPDADVVTYAWSWCPLRADGSGNFACMLSEAELQDAVTASGGDASGLGYDLGSGPTASFTHGLDPSLLAAICTTPWSVGAAGSVPPPDCSEGFPVSIGLTVRQGAHEVQAFKTLYLALDGAAPVNHNPTIDGIAIGPEDASQDGATLLDAAAPSYAVTLGDAYELFADVPNAAAETYVPGGASTAEPESLVLTWFIEGGTTSHVRTTYLEGVADWGVLTRNTWTLPQPEEEARDVLALYLVLRDNRGGVAWLRREVEVVRP